MEEYRREKTLELYCYLKTLEFREYMRERRYNHNHDARGRFASGSSGGIKSSTTAMYRKSDSSENDGLHRKEDNTGAFKKLKVPMQKRAVEKICRSYGVDISDVHIKIQRDENLLNSQYYGSADYLNIGRIDLFPNAFTDETQLIRTIIHEKTHVSQLRKYGNKYCEKHLAEMEKEAYSAEDKFIASIRKK